MALLKRECRAGVRPAPSSERIGVCAEPCPDTVGVRTALRARLLHAEEHVDPVIKSGPLADAEEGLDVIEDVIDALMVGGGVGVRMCERSLSRARAKAQTDRSHR